jgi:hypothetical protein
MLERFAFRDTNRSAASNVHCHTCECRRIDSVTDYVYVAQSTMSQSNTNTPDEDAPVESLDNLDDDDITQLSCAGEGRTNRVVG